MWSAKARRTGLLAAVLALVYSAPLYAEDAPAGSAELDAAAEASAERYVDVELPSRGQIIRAGRGFRWLDATWRPFLGGGVMYDSNPFLTETDERPDVIALATIGLRVDREGADYRFSAEGAGTGEFYLDANDEGNDDLDFLDVYGKAEFEMKTARSFGRVRDTVTRREDAQVFHDGVGGVVIVTTDRVRQVQNAFAFEGGWTSESGKFGVEIDYRNFWSDFGPALHTFSHWEHAVEPRALWHATAKTSLYAAYTFRLVDFTRGGSPNDDWSSHAGAGGVRWLPTAKVSVDARVGFVYQDLRETTTTFDDDEAREVNARVAIGWEATAKTRVLFAYTRDIYAAPLSSFQTADTAAAEVRTALTPKVTWVNRVWYQHTDPSADPTYHSFGFRSAAAVQIFDRFSGWALYEYRGSRTDQAAAEYDAHRVGVGLSIVF